MLGPRRPDGLVRRLVGSRIVEVLPAVAEDEMPRPDQAIARSAEVEALRVERLVGGQGAGCDEVERRLGPAAANGGMGDVVLEAEMLVPVLGRRFDVAAILVLDFHALRGKLGLELLALLFQPRQVVARQDQKPVDHALGPAHDPAVGMAGLLRRCGIADKGRGAWPARA